MAHGMHGSAIQQVDVGSSKPGLYMCGTVMLLDVSAAAAAAAS